MGSRRFVLPPGCLRRGPGPWRGCVLALIEAHDVELHRSFFPLRHPLRPLHGRVHHAVYTDVRNVGNGSIVGWSTDIRRGGCGRPLGRGVDGPRAQNQVGSGAHGTRTLRDRPDPCGVPHGPGRLRSRPAHPLDAPAPGAPPRGFPGGPPGAPWRRSPSPVSEPFVGKEIRPVLEGGDTAGSPLHRPGGRLVRGGSPWLRRGRAPTCWPMSSCRSFGGAGMETVAGVGAAFETCRSAGKLRKAGTVDPFSLTLLCLRFGVARARTPRNARCRFC